MNACIRIWRRGFAPLLAALLLVTAGSPVGAQDDDTIASVTSAATELAELEVAGELIDVYDRIAVDARVLVPRAALGGLYESGALPIPVAEPEVTDVRFEDWESDLTGESYEDAAVVTFEGEVDQAGEVSPETWERAFVLDGLRWRWLLEADDAEIEPATERVDDELAFESDLARRDHQRIDAFWAGVFEQADLRYEPPRDIVGIRTEPFETGCGVEESIDDAGIYYCTLDETVYYSPAFRAFIIDEVGSYAWTHIISHEWGHHIQNQLGIGTSRNPELDGGLYTIELELQADCLSGIYAQDALARGTIDEDDFEEAEDVTSQAGDAPRTAWDDVLAHGTSDQRVESMLTGYEDGFFGCNFELEVVD